MLFESSYNTISKASEAIFRDKGSKFIAYLYPVKTEKEVKEKLQFLKKEHFGANHHCYGYRIGPDKAQFRFNDDGEPAGTAGRPILNQIQSFDLTNVLVVVVRYFGGTLLGVSGLINAYKTATQEAIKNTEIINKSIMEVYDISFNYDSMPSVMKILKDQKAEIENQNFVEHPSLRFAIGKTTADHVIGALKKIEGLNLKYIKTE